jgi:hypothetical protein
MYKELVCIMLVLAAAVGVDLDAVLFNLQNAIQALNG